MWITFFFNSFDLCVISVHSYGGIEPIFWAIESFPPKSLTLVEHMQMNSTQILSDWMSLSPLLFQDFSPSLDLVLAMCAHHLGSYTLCVINSIYFHTTLQAMKIMLICGFHLHSRYSIGISIYYFII